jgi:hypothetical protein
VGQSLQRSGLPHLDGSFGDTDRFGDLADRELFEVSQDEDFAILALHVIQRKLYTMIHFFSHRFLDNAGSWRRDDLRQRHDRIVGKADIDFLSHVAFAGLRVRAMQACQRLPSNPAQPRIKRNRRML